MFHRWMLLPLIGLAAAVHAAPLSYRAALDRAERESPSLDARSTQIEADRSTAVAADALPDPKLFIGVDNLPVGGADRWSLNRDFMTMQKIGVVQEVPNADKRHARAESAAAGVARSEAERRVELNRVRRETALAWINRYYLERRLAAFDDLERENRLLADAVAGQLAAGRGQPAEAVAPQMEAAQLADRRDELHRDLVKATAVLRRYVGAAADDALDGEPPHYPVDAATLRGHVHHHPELQAFAPQTRLAEAQVREAEAAKKSDWGVEMAYQRRGPQFGDMISLQVSFDLPLFGGTRQDPQIAAKRRELARIDLEREAMLREHVADLESDIADYAALYRQFERLQQTVLPLTREKVDLQFASYRGGKSDIGQLLAARRELIEQRLKWIDVDSQREAAAARLHFAYGEDMQ